MKILLTGAGGLLGPDLWAQLTSKGHDLWAVGRHRPPFVNLNQWRALDVSKDNETYSVITRLNPDLVIHAAAMSGPDLCEISPEEAFRTNALGTRNVALACQRFDATLLFISTNYVFSGADCPPDGYREFDSPAPVNRYGLSKKWAEDFVRMLLNKFFIIRTAGLFGSARSCFALQIMKACQEGKPIEAATDWVGSVTYTLDMAEAISKLAETNLYGIYHLTNHGSCSRWEFATHAASRSVPTAGFEIRKIRVEDLGLQAPRPHRTVLDNLHWRLSGFEPTRNWRAALQDFLEKNEPRQILKRLAP